VSDTGSPEPLVFLCTDQTCHVQIKENDEPKTEIHCIFGFFFKFIFRHCGIRDPSWSELHHFVNFLNKQLQDFEVSAFCGLAAVIDLQDLLNLVLDFSYKCQD